MRNPYWLFEEALRGNPLAIAGLLAWVVVGIILVVGVLKVVRKKK